MAAYFLLHMRVRRGKLDNQQDVAGKMNEHYLKHILFIMTREPKNPPRTSTAMQLFVPMDISCIH